jgi:thiol-disulfide isomerase/thioredoxin
MDSVNKMGLKLSEIEKQTLQDLASGKTLTGKDAVSKEEAECWTRFNAANKNLISSTSIAVYHETVSALMKKYFRLEPGLVTDFVLSQRLAGLMKSSMEPLNAYEIKVVHQRITTPEIRNYLLASSREMGEKVKALQAESKKKTGYFVHTAPVAKADSLFEAIVKKHPGKVLFIDYWATWCSPCKEGIQRMKPLKEEFIGKDVEFIYITGPSSPQKTYDLMVPDIKGQHYRVDKDGWNFLCSRFKISGIPHYMLVGKNGKIVSEDLGGKAESNEAIKKLLEGELKK